MKTPSATISLRNDLMVVSFDRFGLEEYETFLKCKRLPESKTIHDADTMTYRIEAPARFASMLGVELERPQVTDLPISEFLFDDQRYLVPLLLEAKRFALWSGCGSGKTLVGLECAKHIIHRTGGRVLITTRNEIVQQWIDEAAKFYGNALPIHRIRTRQALREWCKDGSGQLGITNYEKWNPEDLDHQVVTEAKHLTCLILDEGSRLRGSAGKQKWALIKSSRGIEYKYSLTATPAPNELMEFASQASFLEKMRSEGEIIWTYFLRDNITHRWTVKPHARADFFRWMASWSIYINDPKRFGWRLDQPEIPTPVVTVHPVPATQEQLDKLCELTADASGQMNLPGVCDTDLNVVRASRLSQAAKGFIYLKGQGSKYKRIASNKPKVVTDIVRSEAAMGLQVIVWTVFTAESELLAERLGGVNFDLLNGRTKEGDRLAILERFRTGQTPVLITLADMIGWGMNLQCCGSMVLSGWTFGFESYFQLVRRAYRYGQTKRLRVHIPVVQELEQEMLNTIFHKEAQHMASIGEMEGNYLAARMELKI